MDSKLLILLIACVILGCSSPKTIPESTPCETFESLPEISAEIIGGFRTISQRLHYPEGALSQKIGGAVKLALYIDSFGNVVNVEVTKSVHPSLDSEASRVAYTLKAVPAKHKGVTVCSRLPMPIIFSPPR